MKTFQLIFECSHLSNCKPTEYRTGSINKQIGFPERELMSKKVLIRNYRRVILGLDDQGPKVIIFGFENKECTTKYKSFYEWKFWC